MPAFKPKANKKIKHDEKSTVTLDHKHKEMLDKLKNPLSLNSKIKEVS